MLKRRSIWTVVGCAGVVLATDGRVHAQPPQYEITDLGSLPGEPSCLATTLNDVGQVVGYCAESRVGALSNSGFIWDTVGMTDLGGLPGYEYIYPLAINNNAQVIGYVSDVQTHRPFIWDDGVMTDLNDLLPEGSGWELGLASDINDAGQIVGGGTINDEYHAYLLEAGSITDLGTFLGTSSSGVAINASGQIVGGYFDAQGGGHAFLWEDGVFTPIGPIDGNYTSPADINESIVVVGSFGTADGKSMSSYPFRWEAGQITELDPADTTSTSACAVNNIGQIVGWGRRFDGSYFSVGTIWIGDNRYELYDLIPPDSGWYRGLGYAADINDRGQIVGHSWTDPIDGNDHAYLLTPIVDPVPAMSFWGLITTALLLITAGSVAIIRRRQWPGINCLGLEHGSWYTGECYMQLMV